MMTIKYIKWDFDAWQDYLYWKKVIKFSSKELTKLLKILKGVLLKELASQKH